MTVKTRTSRTSSLPPSGLMSPHLKWEEWFAQLGDIGTLTGKMPIGVTVGKVTEEEVLA